MSSPGPAPHPVKLERMEPNGLLITWSDGRRLKYTASALRKACPCATCREKQSAREKNPFQLTILKPEETVPLTIRVMKPVGTYAYAIDFSDGHSTGIFTFENLLSLGEPAS